MGGCQLPFRHRVLRRECRQPPIASGRRDAQLIVDFMERDKVTVQPVRNTYGATGADVPGREGCPERAVPRLRRTPDWLRSRESSRMEVGNRDDVVKLTFAAIGRTNNEGADERNAVVERLSTAPVPRRGPDRRLFEYLHRQRQATTKLALSRRGFG
jgi:hypothetical protein